WMRLFHGTPLVMCYEGTPHTERNAGFLRTWYRRLASKAMDRIVCNGSLSREYIEQLGFPKEKIGLGNMAADIKRFEAKALELSQTTKEALRQRLGAQGKILLFVGRLVPLKGLDKLLEGWKEVFGEQPGTTLLIVGEGPQEKELQAYCRANRLDNVRFAGAVDHREIPAYLALADVFIIPTLQDNWSLVVPEAMASKLPVACSLYNGCWPELIYGDNGWVFDPLDRENLAQTLKQIMADADRWEAMGRASLDLVRAHSPKKIAEGLHETCRSLKAQN